MLARQRRVDQCRESMLPETSPNPQTPSEPSGASLADAEAKIRMGVKLSAEEKAVVKEAYKSEKAPVTLDELEFAHDQILKRLTKQTNTLPAKELPKVLEIFRTAITERKSKGEKGDLEKAKEPTRDEMLAALQGRRAKVEA